MKWLYLFVVILTAAFSISAEARTICHAGYHAVAVNQCCPTGAVLNRKGQCAYPTKNHCPSGFHPQRNNTCCPLDAVLTDDGMCTSYGGWSSPGDDDGGGDYGVHKPDPLEGIPAFYPQSGNDTCPYAQCVCQSGAQAGQAVINSQSCN